MYILAGRRGCGKTCLLAKLMIERNDVWVVVRDHDRKAYFETIVFDKLRQQFCLGNDVVICSDFDSARSRIVIAHEAEKRFRYFDMRLAIVIVEDVEDILQSIFGVSIDIMSSSELVLSFDEDDEKLLFAKLKDVKGEADDK